MVQVVHYEDIMNEINNRSALRKKLICMVEQHKIIHITGLSSAQRHLIYSQMFYPLTFEKIENKKEDCVAGSRYNETIIKVFNRKIKNTAERTCNNTEKDTEETRAMVDTSFVEIKDEEHKNEDTEESNEESEEENSTSESDSNSDSNSDSDVSYEESYITEYEENFEKLENMSSQIVELTNKVISDVNRIKSYVRNLFVINIIGWVLFYSIDPIKVVILRENSYCVN